MITEFSELLGLAEIIKWESIIFTIALSYELHGCEKIHLVQQTNQL